MPQTTPGARYGTAKMLLVTLVCATRVGEIARQMGMAGAERVTIIQAAISEWGRKNGCIAFLISFASFTDLASYECKAFVHGDARVAEYIVDYRLVCVHCACESGGHPQSSEASPHRTRLVSKGPVEGR